MSGDAKLVPLTVAAQELGISKSLAYKLAAEKGELCPKLPVLRFGRTVKVVRAHLDRVISGDTQRAESA